MQSNGTIETLLAELTLQEKIGLLHQHAAAVPRLGLAPFRTGTEGLHGVSWLGEATVLPQAVGLGATWDEDLLTRVGTAIGVEVRAKHAADPVGVGLNVWAPVVNPLRHPLWGRNEEGLHEDATFSGRFGSALARGLRGGHPDVWLTVPTLKHFLGYGNETRRDATSSQLRERVLHEEELPAYLVPLADGTVGALMPSYNLVNGVPSHVTPLLARHLRTAPGGDDLLVVSDAVAPSNLFRTQGYPDGAHAYAATLLAGVDSFTDDNDDPAPSARRLADALEAGLIEERDIDRAVRRHLLARARTGEFSPDRDPYAGITPASIGAAEHTALAREAATKAVVVLTNPRGGLPLTGDRTARIAVLGELGSRVLTDWYSGTPISTVSLAEALAARFGDTVAADAGNDTIRLRLDQPGHPFDGHDLGEYELGEWGEGVCTLRSLAEDRFLTRAGNAVVPTATRVGGWEVQESFRLLADGGGRTRVKHLGADAFVQLERRTGQLRTTGYDDREPGTWAVTTSGSGLERARRLAAEASATLVVIGNDPHLNGRETEDRTTLAVPVRARELVRTARAATDGPVVLVVVSSYPYALAGLEDEVDAVVWSSHGGEQIGEALAAVLLGEAEPYGRLPQTWFAADGDLPDILEYDCIAASSTYAYSPATPLFPLGHGLTYTSLQYGDATAGGSPGSDDLVVTVPVANTGSRPADELVQVYVTAPAHPLGFPRRRLAGTARVHLEPGDRVEARIAVPRRALSVWDVARDDWWLAEGEYHLLVGRSAQDVRAEVRLGVAGEPAAVRRLTERPVPAAAFDAHDGALLVPRQANTGSAVTGRSPSVPFSLVFERCVLDGARHLEVTVQAPGARKGWVELLARRDAGAWVALGRTASAELDHEQRIAFELPAFEMPGDGQPVVALRLRVSPGLLVSELQAR